MQAGVAGGMLAPARCQSATPKGFPAGSGTPPSRFPRPLCTVWAAGAGLPLPHQQPKRESNPDHVRAVRADFPQNPLSNEHLISVFIKSGNKSQILLQAVCSRIIRFYAHSSTGNIHV
jgi:hypothetical protein